MQNIPKEPGERRARPHDLVVPISEKRGDKRRERRREGLVYGLEEFNTERILSMWIFATDRQIQID